MAHDANSRIRKELLECQRDEQSSGVHVEQVAGSLTHLHGTVHGPADTPYAGMLRW